jgi:hypothetical protein
MISTYTGGFPMAAHDAEYFRQRRRQQGVLPRDPLSAPRFLKHGAELRRLEQLPWPRNLFGENATIAELMAEAALIDQGAQISDELCPCGCRREHKHRVAQTLRNPYGRGYDIIYFSSDACKSKWDRERVEKVR